ncbi:MAG TPA: M1 family aminopeptidase, partial [Chitinophagaceae bacterium]|nr:M1 family aminopeptidase [Chitinophagaceae bacterium]
MVKKIAACILLGSVFIGACRSAKHRNSLSGSMDTVTVSAFNNPMNQYRATAPQEWWIRHTHAALSFDYKEKTANGRATLSLQPYFYALDSLVLDAKSMDIKSVQLEPGHQALAYTYDSSQLHIRLDKSYTRYEQLKLSIEYIAKPYARSGKGGSTAIRDDRGLYFINADSAVAGKPVQIWTQGETEANSNWLPTIDKPNMRTTVELDLTVPAQYKTLSNGALVGSREHGATRTDTWKTDLPIQVYAIMFAVGDFHMTKDRWQDKEVNYYVEPAFAPYARKMFQYTPEMIGFFSGVTGVPYPWNKYSQVVVRDYVSGAMENTSASLFGEFMNQDEREYDDENHEDVVSHELFHQWFGDYVTA